jgi:hypothetical protein
MLTKQALAVILVPLLALPAWANPIVVGSVSRSKVATVRGTELTPGHTIFSDDTIVVGKHGSAWIALTDGAQVQLAEQSQVRLTKSADKVQLTIDRSLASFRTAEKSEVEALLGDATIRSADAMPAVGIISVRSPQSAIIAAQKGALLISTAHDARSLTLREGEAAEVKLVPEQDNDKNKKKVPGAAPAGSWTAGKVVILAVILAGTATGIGVLLGQNEVQLSQTEKKNAVSPFTLP